MRTIEWESTLEQVRLIDQRRLPGAQEYLYCSTADEMASAIQTMAIRGAPALGVAGAFGLVLEARRIGQVGELRERLRGAARVLGAARPTAVNLTWGLKRMMELLEDPQLTDLELSDRLLAEAMDMAEEDVRTNLLLAKNGASLIADEDTIIHHCNTGSLAGVDWGTAFGAIRHAHEHGKRVHVLVDETRPRLQGARLTAWECEQYGIPYEIITDNAAGFFLQRGEVNKVFFGADRVAANGDVINKVGTYMLAAAAHANKVPVICVFPLSTLDMQTSCGEEVLIEERDQTEVLNIQYEGEPVTPKAAKARNPAFDVTPHELISAWVTEKGVINPPFVQNLAGCVYNTGLDR